MREKQEGYAVPLVSGAMHTLEAYKYQTGKIAGLNEAQVILKDFYKSFTEETPVGRQHRSFTIDVEHDIERGRTDS